MLVLYVFNSIVQYCGVAAVPLQSCSFKSSPAHSVTSFADTCLLLSRRSASGNDSSVECERQNAKLLDATNNSTLSFLQWWLEQVDLTGFIWIEASPDANDPESCTELYKDELTQKWLTRNEKCDFKNYFVCEQSGFQTTCTCIFNVMCIRENKKTVL